MEDLNPRCLIQHAGCVKGNPPLSFELKHNQGQAMEEEKDEVSAMQDALDNLALSMFDSLRLIQFSREVKGNRVGAVAQPGAEEPVTVQKPVATDAAWANQVQNLAQEVLKKADCLNRLIDNLPGADLHEDQQLQEITRLDKEGRRTRANLTKIADQAEELRNDVNNKLDRLADHMLNVPR